MAQNQVMRQRSVIIWCIAISWVVLSILAIVLIDIYIEKKTERLRIDIRTKVQQLFEGRQDRGDGFIEFDDGIFDVSFNNGKVKNYKRGQIPSKPKKSEFHAIGGGTPESNYQKRLNEWREQWGEVSSVWDLNWGSNELDELEDEGWNLIRLYCRGLDDEFIQASTMFPYQVALKKTEWGNYYTVPEAIREAYDFYTTDPNSDYSDGFSKGSHRELWNKIHEASNDYFWITENPDKTRYYYGHSIPGGSDYTKGGPIHIGSMFNGYYTVHIATTQEKYYKIEKYPWNPDIQERNNLYILWLSGIFLLCLIPIIILMIKKHKASKRQKETLRDKLLRLCSPSAFMDNYDKEKITAANSIYQEILNCKDETGLMDIAERAQQTLSINLIPNDDLKKLLEKTNPKKFMAPYDPHKVSLANELYSILNNPNITYKEYLEVLTRSKNLYQ